MVSEAERVEEKRIQHRHIPPATTTDNERDAVREGLHSHHADRGRQESLLPVTSADLTR